MENVGWRKNVLNQQTNRTSQQTIKIFSKTVNQQEEELVKINLSQNFLSTTRRKSQKTLLFTNVAKQQSFSVLVIDVFKFFLGSNFKINILEFILVPGSEI